jgi:hypothetical protein
MKICVSRKDFDTTAKGEHIKVKEEIKDKGKAIAVTGREGP